MKYLIQSPHLRVSEKLQSMVQTKLDRLEKIFDRIEQCHVVLKKENNQQQERSIIEVKLGVPGKDLFVQVQAVSFEAALENVYHALGAQIRKHKAKLGETSAQSADQYVNDEELE